MPSSHPLERYQPNDARIDFSILAYSLQLAFPSQPCAMFLDAPWNRADFESFLEPLSLRIRRRFCELRELDAFASLEVSPCNTSRRLNHLP
jgi:hypothetical protein